MLSFLTFVEEFGVMGLTISGLISLVAWIVTTNQKHEEKRSEENRKLVVRLDNRHRRERMKIESNREKRDEAVTQVIRELRTTILEAASRQNRDEK